MSDCHSVTVSQSVTQITRGLPLIALAGQPNVGKSTIFNSLTGLSQHVGNWPGKTIERRDGTFTAGSATYRLVDLPGTYSLTANSPEEVLARDFILRERPDAVIAVVNAASLERSLYLVAELICLPPPLIVVLNMMDVAEQEGVHIEPRVLEVALGVPVLAITATRAGEMRELLQTLEDLFGGRLPINPRPPEIRADHRAILDEIHSYIEGYVPESYPAEWFALKLLEGDSEISSVAETALPPEEWQVVDHILRQHDDALLAVASGRYEWVGRMVRAAVVQPRMQQISWTQRIDQVATHPVWGTFFLAGILGIVFGLTFELGAPIQNWLAGQVVGNLAALLNHALAGAPSWLSGIAVDGVLRGVGAVLTFLPIMVIFFAVFGLLEDTGYMARAAYVMDNLMHVMGLHGKSFLPLFLGFGCNVPAVMGTRVIDSKPARLLSTLIAPFIPCTARMAVVAFIAPAFFGAKAVFVSWGLVMVSLLVLVASGVILNRILFKGERSAFIMEMPLYHIPNGRTIGLLVWQRSVSFVNKAGTSILAMSIVVWALSVLPGGSLNGSYIAQLGRLVAPIGQLMGLDWRLMVALISSFPAKENAVATLGVLFASAPRAGLADTLRSTYSTASALSFLVVTMLFVPCLATVATIRQETKSWSWTLLNTAMFMIVSILAGTGVYHLALLVGA